MYHEINLANVDRLARIVVEDGMLYYEADLNPDACEPIQGVAYTMKEGLTREYAASRVNATKDPYAPFMEIIADTYLYDAMTLEQALVWLGVDEHPIIVCDNLTDAIDAFKCIPDGCAYVFYFPATQHCK